MNELATMAEVFKELTQQQMKSFSCFAFTYSLSASFIQCLLDQFRQCLKTDILPTCDFCICLKDTQVRSFLSHSADHIVDTNTIVSHKYAPSFCNLSLSTNAGGLIRRMQQFFSRLRPPFWSLSVGGADQVRGVAEREAERCS